MPFKTPPSFPKSWQEKKEKCLAKCLFYLSNHTEWWCCSSHADVLVEDPACLALTSCAVLWQGVPGEEGLPGGDTPSQKVLHWLGLYWMYSLCIMHETVRDACVLGFLHLFINLCSWLLVTSSDWSKFTWANRGILCRIEEWEALVGH